MRRRAAPPRPAGARRSDTTASDTIIASLWAGAVAWLNPSYAWWLTPVVTALIVSVPLSVWTSRERPGQRARESGLLVTPDEIAPAPEIRDVQRDVAAAELERALFPEWRSDGFTRAVVDPLQNAVHCALIGSGRSFAEKLRNSHAALVDRAVAGGPRALGASERRRLLRDPEAMLALHKAVWELADRDRARAGASRLALVQAPERRVQLPARNPITTPGFDSASGSPTAMRAATTPFSTSAAFSRSARDVASFARRSSGTGIAAT